MYQITSVEDAKKLEGQEVGVSDWIVVDQDRIDKFADATGDYQWIHVDTERASRELEDGKTIAHGYLTLALITSLSASFVEMPNLLQAINFGCKQNPVLYEGARRQQSTRQGDHQASSKAGGCVAPDI